MSEATQALCFMAGANSIFTGDKLLTVPNDPLPGDPVRGEAMVAGQILFQGEALDIGHVGHRAARDIARAS